MKNRYIVAFSAILLIGAPAFAATMHVGAATVSITPDQPVAVNGQMNTRIARIVESEVQANAFAIESRDGDRILD